MFNDNIDQLLQILKNSGCEACLLEDPIDLYYFTQLSLSAGSLYISTQEIILFVDGRYFENAKQRCSIEVRAKESLKNFLTQNPIKKIAFDSAKISVDALLQKKEELPKTDWVAFPLLTKKLRVIKSSSEQNKMQSAADLSKKAFRYAVEGLKEGVKENEIAWRYEKFCRESGAMKMAFEPIVAFGENTAFPHHRATNKKLEKNAAVLIDVGCVLDHYASDMTRMILNENVHPEIRKLDEVVRAAKKAAIDKCKPGVKIKELDLAAREEMRKEGLEAFFSHSLGHGIGLETHEFPRLTSKSEEGETILQEGMVVTIEPGLYRPGIGGVRIEDTVILTKDGVLNLYGDLP